MAQCDEDCWSYTRLTVNLRCWQENEMSLQTSCLVIKTRKCMQILCHMLCILVFNFYEHEHPHEYGQENIDTSNNHSDLATLVIHFDISVFGINPFVKIPPKMV